MGAVASATPSVESWVNAAAGKYRRLDLRSLLSTDSTFYGDLFAHVVSWRGSLYLEDGLHRALRAALQGRPVVHGRVLDLDAPGAR